MSNELKNSADKKIKDQNRNVRVELLKEVVGIQEGPKEDGVVSERLKWVQSQLMAMNVKFKEVDENDGYDFYEPASMVSFTSETEKPITLYIAPVSQVVEDEGVYTFDRASSTLMGLELVRRFTEKSEKEVNAVVLFMEGQEFNLSAYQITTIMNFGLFGKKVERVVEVGPFAGHDFRVKSRIEEVQEELKNEFIDKGLKTQNHDWGSEITSVLEELGVPALLVDSYRAKEPALQWTDWYSPEDQIEFAATSDFELLCEILFQFGVSEH